MLMEHLLGILALFTNTMVGYLVWKMKKKDTTKEAEKKALSLLLRREMRDMYDILKDQKTITAAQFNEFDEMYQVYHGLGGNGSGTHMYDKIKEKEIDG